MSKSVKHGVKGRVYLTEIQVPAAARQFGCARFVYNHLLEFSKSRYTADKTRTSPARRKRRRQSVCRGLENLCRGTLGIRLPKHRKTWMRVQASADDAGNIVRDEQQCCLVTLKNPPALAVGSLQCGVELTTAKGLRISETACPDNEHENFCWGGV